MRRASSRPIGSLSIRRVVPNRTASDRSAGPSTVVELGEGRAVGDARRRRASRAAPRRGRRASPPASRRRIVRRPPSAVAAGEQRPPQDRRRGTLRGREVDVPRRQREAVGLADGRAGDDLGRDREVAGHLADDHHLLGVLLAEVRVLRADQVEQDRDDGRDAVEVAGPGGALERPRRPPRRTRSCRSRAGRPRRRPARRRGRGPPPRRSRGRGPRSAGSAGKSAASLNWRGLTKIVAIVVALSARARCISERWPSWSQPIVGTSPSGRAHGDERLAQLGPGADDAGRGREATASGAMARRSTARTREGTSKRRGRWPSPFWLGAWAGRQTRDALGQAGIGAGRKAGALTRSVAARTAQTRPRPVRTIVRAEGGEERRRGRSPSGWSRR